MKNHTILKKTASLWNKADADLGESPVWIPETKELLWVDINKGEVHATNANTRTDEIIYQGRKISCIAPISNKEILIADTNKLVKFNRLTGVSDTFLGMKFKTPNVRFNDGKVDPNGNLWLGTMEMDLLPNKGHLYLIDAKKNVSEKLDNITISNGLSWSLDKKTMYYIDTADNVVYAFDFNAKSEISNQRIVIKIPKDLGVPDGMTIDSKGNLWIALWGGYAVGCWNPKSGKMLEKIEVAAPHVTSCTFGGDTMDILFITTARDGLSPLDLKKFPNSGNIFYVKSKVAGCKAHYYNNLAI